MKMLRLSSWRGSIDFAPPITGRALWNRGPNIKLWSLHDCETVDRTATDLNAPSVAKMEHRRPVSQAITNWLQVGEKRFNGTIFKGVGERARRRRRELSTD